MVEEKSKLITRLGDKQKGTGRDGCACFESRALGGEIVSVQHPRHPDDCLSRPTKSLKPPSLYIV